jgi:hypothetical protein
VETRIIGQVCWALDIRLRRKQACSRKHFNLTCQSPSRIQSCCNRSASRRSEDCCASFNMASPRVTSGLEGLASAWNQPAATAAELGARGVLEIIRALNFQETRPESKKAPHRLLKLPSLLHISSFRWPFFSPKLKPIHYGAI